MKIYLRAAYVQHKNAQAESTKAFIKYVKEKGFPFKDEKDDWNTTVIVDCEDSKVAGFITKVCEKFKCKAIIETEKSGAGTWDVSIFQDSSKF